jgi:hypothetical protein
VGALYSTSELNHEGLMCHSHRAYNYLNFQLKPYADRGVPAFTRLNAFPAKHWPEILKYQPLRQSSGMLRMYERFRA